jgi:hypothetical protein
MPAAFAGPSGIAASAALVDAVDRGQLRRAPSFAKTARFAAATAASTDALAGASIA